MSDPVDNVLMWEDGQLHRSSPKDNNCTTLHWTGISIWACAKLCHTTWNLGSLETLLLPYIVVNRVQSLDMPVTIMFGSLRTKPTDMGREFMFQYGDKNLKPEPGTCVYLDSLI